MNKNIWMKSKGVHCIINKMKLKVWHINTKNCKMHGQCPKDKGELPNTNPKNHSQVSELSVLAATIVAGQGFCHVSKERLQYKEHISVQLCSSLNTARVVVAILRSPGHFCMRQPWNIIYFLPLCTIS